MTFLTSSAWGRWQGALAVGLLKDQGIKIVSLNPDGRADRRDGSVGRQYGRIRTVQYGPDKALYFTTSNGTHDRIVKLIPPRAPPTYRPGHNVSPVGVSAARRPDSVDLRLRPQHRQRGRYRRSTDDGRTWGTWVEHGTDHHRAPAVASSDVRTNRPAHPRRPTTRRCTPGSSVAPVVVGRSRWRHHRGTRSPRWPRHASTCSSVEQSDGTGLAEATSTAAPGAAGRLSAASSPRPSAPRPTASPA